MVYIKVIEEHFNMCGSGGCLATLYSDHKIGQGQ